MMQEMARVISQDDSGWVQVEVQLKSACNHCSNSDNCGASSVAKAFGTKVQRFSIVSHKPCKEGDILKLGLSESVVLKAAALVYMMPLFGLFVGAILGQWLASVVSLSPDLSSLVGAIIGAVLFWMFGKRKARQLEAQAQPVILAYIGQPIATNSICSS